MTLSQRLVRAGLSFIVFGTAAALVPSDGNAFSATDTCTIPAQSDTVGTFPHQKNAVFNVPGTKVGKILTLNSYTGSALTMVKSISESDPINFHTEINGSSVQTKRSTTGSHLETVTVTFMDNHTVTYTVTE